MAGAHDNDGNAPDDLPDLPEEWGVIVIPDDLSELADEVEVVRAELRQSDRSDRWRRLFDRPGLRQLRQAALTLLRAPVLIISMAVLVTVASLFASAWPGPPRQPVVQRTNEDHEALPALDLVGDDGHIVPLRAKLPAVILVTDGCDCARLISDTAAAAKDRPQIAIVVIAAALSGATSAQATSSQAPSTPATSAQATSSQATSSQPANGQATGGQAASAQATGGQATTGQATTGQATGAQATGAQAGGRATSGQASGQAATGQASGGQAASGKATDTKSGQSVPNTHATPGTQSTPQGQTTPLGQAGQIIEMLHNLPNGNVRQQLGLGQPDGTAAALFVDSTGKIVQTLKRTASVDAIQPFLAQI